MIQKILDYPVFARSLEDCAGQIAAAIAAQEHACRIMACLNPHSYVTAKNDTYFQSALKQADWLVPDGTGVVLASKILGTPLPGRITGPDLFTRVMERLDNTGGSVFFLGSSKGTLGKIRAKLQMAYPNVTLAGTYSPPYKSEFSDAENDAMIEAVNATSPDVLWVGMTAPKQEKWLNAHRERLNVNVAGSIGAAFDFFAGTVERSPNLMRKLGLEWLHRSLMSPRRLGHRNMMSNPVFLAEVFRTLLRNRL